MDWGVPVHDDNKHFEYLILEGAQAGLSWLTILKRRENYRKVYDGFDPEIVASYDEEKIQTLLSDPGIIRNKLKVRASVNNAILFRDIQKEFGSFDNYIWGYTGGKTVKNTWKDLSELPAKTELSDKISTDLKKRGFKFTGSTIIYAHLQAAGIVNDHVTDCFRYDQV
jgi:DNA-3-methyladenine glycosylase I